MAYVYLHTKPNGEIFYVCKGTGYRAYDKNHRSSYWKRVVNKYGYEVKIFLDNISDEKALSVEMDLIEAIGLEGVELVDKPYIAHVVELGFLPIEKAEYDEEGNVIKEAVLSDKFSVDVLWESGIEARWNTYEIEPEISSHKFA